jgi:outer membrane lipoprotein carrier protein
MTHLQTLRLRSGTVSKTLLAGLLLLCLSGALFCALAESEQIRAIQNRYLATETFTARFVQTDRRAGDSLRQATGELRYKRGMMRWHYDTPEEQLIVTNGQTLWLYDPLLENVTIQPLEAVADGTALAFLLGIGDLENDFTLRPETQKLFDAPQGEVVELAPFEPMANLDFLQMEVHPKTLELQALAIADLSGNVRLIRLEQVQRDVPLDDSEFVFEVQPGMEVIRTD